MSSLELPVLSTDQMREIDRIMVEDLDIDLTRMMERAGHSLAEVARAMSRWREGLRVTVLAGGGNNGGGGLVAARNLHNWGADVTVILDRPADEIRGVPGEQLAILARLGIELEPAHPRSPEAVVDALVGYGIHGDPTGRTADLITWARGAGDQADVVSLDGPSGLDLTTGLAGDPTVIASATVTLALPKRGALAASARPVVGRLFVADIGVPPEAFERIGLGRIHPFSSASILEIKFAD